MSKEMNDTIIRMYRAGYSVGAIAAGFKVAPTRVLELHSARRSLEVMWDRSKLEWNSSYFGLDIIRQGLAYLILRQVEREERKRRLQLERGKQELARQATSERADGAARELEAFAARKLIVDVEIADCFLAYCSRIDQEAADRAVSQETSSVALV